MPTNGFTLQNTFSSYAKACSRMAACQTHDEASQCATAISLQPETFQEAGLLIPSLALAEIIPESASLETPIDDLECWPRIRQYLAQRFLKRWSEAQTEALVRDVLNEAERKLGQLLKKKGLASDPKEVLLTTYRRKSWL